ELISLFTIQSAKKRRDVDTWLQTKQIRATNQRTVGTIEQVCLWLLATLNNHVDILASDFPIHLASGSKRKLDMGFSPSTDTLTGNRTQFKHGRLNSKAR